jgi:hypothetical protein
MLDAYRMCPQVVPPESFNSRHSTRRMEGSLNVCERFTRLRVFKHILIRLSPVRKRDQNVTNLRVQNVHRDSTVLSPFWSLWPKRHSARNRTKRLVFHCPKLAFQRCLVLGRGLTFTLGTCLFTLVVLWDHRSCPWANSGLESIDGH